MLALVAFFVLGSVSCSTDGEVVHVTTVSDGSIDRLGAEDAALVEEIKKSRGSQDRGPGLSDVIGETPQLTVAEYVAQYPDSQTPASDYRIGGTDVISIVVYEEPDLTKEGLPVSREGYISFPLIGRIKVEDLTPSDIEKRIALELAEQKYLIDANVSVTVQQYNSRHFMVLGAVRSPGRYTIQAGERVLDALSRVGGFDRERAASHALLVRILEPETDRESRIIIKINLGDLVKRGDPVSNIYLSDRDVLYFPPVSNYYIIGQVGRPGAYNMPEDEVTLMEAIGEAGGFSQTAARNKTRIIRVEGGVEKIIEVKVDAITREGRKVSDILLKPDDIIVVPESFF
jgi:polysaccharide export outer membrane protein